MKIYHNPRCRKSRETLNILEGRGAQPAVVEYLKTPPDKEELMEILSLLRIKPFELIRKGEEEFVLNFKGKDLSDEEWIDVMVKFPKLIERPIVINGNKAVIGRPPEKVLDIL